MLGEISDGIAELAEEEEEQRRRMMENGCKSTADGYTNPCDKVSCEDPTRFCDGSFNFEYVAFLRGAGCDELDSDGDGLYDVCEDRFRPEIVVREAKLFRCDKDNTTRLCHDETIFNEELLALSFLRYEFAATDDCQATDKLSVDIDYVEGSCRNTKYRLTPVQNVPECHNVTNVGPFKIPFTNPLSGVSKEVYVVLDEEAPFVECGFRSDKTSINEISDDGKTLYHYMLKTHGNGFKLTDADFWYHVTDNCDDDVGVEIVVKSNEVQQNSIAELFKYHTGDSAQQTVAVYAPTTCEDVGEDLFCKKSPLVPKKVRFYEVIVTAKDSACNAASDTCKIAIVSSCNKKYDTGCEKYTSSSGNDDTAGNPNANKYHIENYYIERSLIDEVMNAESQTLYEVAKKELVWNSG
mmetsp:Transcript_14030/g.41087  ORF Transcript_14030/g.41087 Transcript_14030/m.41087 type:complete len:409 (+) Transcript_14030:3459-4685(+)